MLIKKILNPDNNNSILKIYHKSNKIMIPTLFPSLILNDDNSTKKYFDLFNISNLTFHSYFSFSTIITDYHKKIPFINENVFRILNLKCHSFIILYLTYNLYNKNFRPKI